MNRKKKRILRIVAAALLAAVRLSTAALAERSSENDIPACAAETENRAEGWRKIGGKTYYFDSDGVMTVKSRTINGVRYQFGSDGVCGGEYTGWTKGKKGRRYYKNGIMAVNRWIRTKSGKKYYAGADGYMRTGWARIKGTGFCFFDENGVWDEKHYDKGYQPESMKNFLTDFDYSDNLKYEYAINYRKYRDFGEIAAVREILESEKNTVFVFDEFPSDDEIQQNEKIYHGGKEIVIRCDPKSDEGADRVPHIVFSKDKKGRSYFYVPVYGFGCKLSDDGAYDKIKALIP